LSRTLGLALPHDGPRTREADIRPVAYGTYDVVSCSRTELSNLNDVAMQARIVPSFRDGKAVGFKLFSIRPGSIYERLGIKNGDVITRINGFDLNSPEKALEIYSKLREAPRIYLELERGSVPLTLTYRLADGLHCL
jgi:general secretion pathway protein C